MSKEIRLPTAERHTRWPTSLSTWSLDHLSVATLLTLIWLFISVLPHPPNDLWWHMAAGRIMVQEGSWLTTNRWAYTLPFDAPYVYQSWLSEIIMYAAWRLGDVPLLTLLRTVAVTGSYGLIAWHAWRRAAGNGKAVTIAILVAMLIGWNNWTLRPQTLAFLPGTAMVVVLGEYLGGRLKRTWLLMLPAMMILWVNMHGSFILGIVLAGLAWLGVLIETIRAAPTARQQSWQRLRDLTLAGALTGAAAMVHPLGPGIFSYVQMMISNSDLQQRFIEWQPPDNSVDILSTGFWFYALLLGLAVLMASGRRRPSASDLLWYCALAWLGIDAVRYAIWFALGLAPLLAEQLSDRMPSRAPKSWPGFIIGYCVVLGALMMATLPWLTPGRYLGPGAEGIFATSGQYRMLLGNTTPIGASEWLAANPIEGRFWTDMSYSSYTIWALPEKQVFADLRVELFPGSIWDDYFAIAAGNEASLEHLDRWQITHLMLDTRFQEQLYTLLKATPGWCEPYHDRFSSIMIRCTT